MSGWGPGAKTGRKQYNILCHALTAIAVFNMVLWCVHCSLCSASPSKLSLPSQALLLAILSSNTATP